MRISRSRLAVVLAVGVLLAAGLSDPASAQGTFPTPPLPYVGVNPCRVVDTRGNGFTGPYGPPSLTAGVGRDFALVGQCGVPAEAQAVSLNVTAANTLGPGFFLLYPEGGSTPLVSTLNYVGSETVANAAIVPLGPGGLTVIAGVSGADLILDINGYFVDTSLCPSSAVRAGTICVDKYEGSVWETTDATVIAKIRAGTVTLAELTAAGAVQHGIASDDYGAGCPGTANGCQNFYAVSIAGVTPSRFISWFQAAAAARNSHRRLLTNAEWQVAALGTPDGPPCNTTSVDVAATGAAAGCVSNVGAFDMVGNLWEWVADWVPRSPTCGSWNAFSDDHQCLAGAATTDTPGALVRGGASLNGAGAGVFAVTGGGSPSDAADNTGFRAAR